ncbi:SRPBCC family protein [Microbacterium sp. VKM Ac-2923]|uniref:SRPBCC family protein n=1 Tax=Microbacterium sp. VKM Ac-2923 TaxID=2929476 RepID=UPI001FB4CDF6|nr:SRPBCC family protein [Microbacterium sp. VKM Ac-2923]MCJ1706134.1 SRPBCC family protein [Microbacterium sp. VKM Ac-2923]
MRILASAIRESSASPAAFFARWVDHDTWREWSPDTEWVRIEHPVAQGSRGILKPEGGPRVKFVVAELEADRVYTDVTRMPGARLTFRHGVEPTAGGSRVTAEVTIDGPLSGLWARTAFAGFEQSVPADLDRLVAVVEGR